MDIPIIVGVSEITLATVAILVAMRHATKLGALVETTRAIVDTSSTRYLEHFPHYLSRIAEFLAKATSRIDILCDFPAYGRFSSIQAFIDYKTVLERKQVEDDFTINLTCLSPTYRRQALTQQFSSSFSGVRSAPFLKQLDVFLRDYGNQTDNSENIGLERFADLAETANMAMVTDALHRRNFVEVDQPIHIFFWMIDQREAIFSIVNRSEKGLEHGFFTRDDRLIKGFLAICDEYRGREKSLIKALPLT